MPFVIWCCLLLFATVELCFGCMGPRYVWGVMFLVLCAVVVWLGAITWLPGGFDYVGLLFAVSFGFVCLCIWCGVLRL